MSGAIQYLFQKYHDPKVEEAAPVHYTQLDSGLSTMRAIQEGELADHNPQTAWISRGGTRGRAGRGQYNSQNRPASTGQGQYSSFRKDLQQADLGESRQI